MTAAGQQVHDPETEIMAFQVQKLETQNRPSPHCGNTEVLRYQRGYEAWDGDNRTIASRSFQTRNK